MNRMSPRLKIYVLILSAGVFAAIATALVLSESQVVEGQVRRQKWNPRRYPAGTEFIGDQVCAECH